MKVTALLPMKGHSERVPGKNFRDFCGKPLFAWILDTLLSLEEIDSVVINSDACGLLREHGIGEGARVVLRERPPRIRGDAVSMNRVIEDDLAHAASDVYLMTHATNPLLRPETLRRAIAVFGDARAAGAADSLFGVNRFQSRFYRADGSPINHDPDRLVPTQELEPWFEENSNLYLFTPASFAATRARIGERPLLFEIPRFESVDIDDAEGWRHAELLAQALRAEGA